MTGALRLLQSSLLFTAVQCQRADMGPYERECYTENGDDIRCADRECMDRSRHSRCDGYKDCTDGSDEKGCTCADYGERSEKRNGSTGKETCIRAGCTFTEGKDEFFLPTEEQAKASWEKNHRQVFLQKKKGPDTCTGENPREACDENKKCEDGHRCFGAFCLELPKAKKERGCFNQGTWYTDRRNLFRTIKNTSSAEDCQDHCSDEDEYCQYWTWNEDRKECHFYNKNAIEESDFILRNEKGAVTGPKICACAQDTCAACKPYNVALKEQACKRGQVCNMFATRQRNVCSDWCETSKIPGHCLDNGCTWSSEEKKCSARTSESTLKEQDIKPHTPDSN